MSDKMKQFLTFKPESQQRIMQQLSVIDTFKGSWSVLEQSKSNYQKSYERLQPFRALVLPPLSVAWRLRIAKLSESKKPRKKNR